MQGEVKITILNDNCPGRNLLSEHGLSYFIEANGIRILLDAGSSNVFMENAERLQINLEDLDAIVLSHGHWDHGNGLHYISGKRLIAHPDCFQKRYHNTSDSKYVGLSLSKEECASKFSLTLSKQPLELNDYVSFLGEIPRLNSFEAKKTTFCTTDGQDDFMMDDSGLVITTSRGLVIISGCAHAGICNTVQHAIQITNEENVLAVIGGFHLKQNDSLTSKTINWLAKKNIKYVLPSHCTDLPALAQFYNEFGSKQIKTGDVFIF